MIEVADAGLVARPHRQRHPRHLIRLVVLELGDVTFRRDQARHQPARGQVLGGGGEHLPAVVIEDRGRSGKSLYWHILTNEIHNLSPYFRIPSAADGSEAWRTIVPYFPNHIPILPRKNRSV